MATNSSAIAPTSLTPSSTPISLPSSAFSSTPEQSSTPIPSSTPAPSSVVATSVVSASAAPPTTKIIISDITVLPTLPGESTGTVVVIITSVTPEQTSAPAATTSSAKSSSTTTGLAGLQTQQANKSSKGGLSTAGKTAIAVVIPVVVVAALVLAGIFLWKKRKQRKDAEEARRKEVEEYGFNPNNDPTLPAVGAGSVMTEDQSGYRGWGNTTNPSNGRKASTTLSSGLAGVSDSGSNPGGYHSPNSPTQVSEGHSGDPLVAGRRETMDSETIGALGAAPVAGQNRSDIRRGPSNASSSYSAGNRSDNSGDLPIPVNNPQDYYNEAGYYQPTGPYGDGTYGGGQQPVIRDVSARRNTRIENPSVFPQQGNSGIAQNF